MNKTVSSHFSGYIREQSTEQISGDRTAYQFPNDYGASVIYGKGSYGLEVAILYFPPDDKDSWIISETADTNGKLEYIEDLNSVLKGIYDKK